MDEETSELRQIVLRDMQDDNRELEIQLYPDRMYISIEWPVYNGGGMRAESFEMTKGEAISMASKILDIYVDF